jgi:hypothetical protein
MHVFQMQSGRIACIAGDESRATFGPTAATCTQCSVRDTSAIKRDAGPGERPIMVTVQTVSPALTVAREPIMRGLMGSLVTALIVVLGYWLYASKMQSKGAPGTPAQAISSVGVQSDLLSIAQAERIYWAGHGSYASLDELYSSGTLASRKSGRAGYSYSAETSSDNFTVTARCNPSVIPACSSFSIDQSMQVQPIQ